MNDWLLVVLLAMTPIGELRASIPYGVIRGLPIVPVVLVSIIANSIAAIAVYFFFDKTVRIFFRFGVFHTWYHSVVERAQKKIHEQVEKYGWIGVAIFIGIPLPMTGAWTGALGSYLIGLDKKKTIIAIISGVIIAAIIVTIVMLTGIGILNGLFAKSI